MSPESATKATGDPPVSATHTSSSATTPPKYARSSSGVWSVGRKPSPEKAARKMRATASTSAGVARRTSIRVL